MRVLVNASRDLVHSHAGGSEVYVDHVLEGLHQRGHDVHLSVGGPAGDHSYTVHRAGGTFTQYLLSPIRQVLSHRHADVVVDVANGMSYFSPLVRSGPTVCLVHHIHTEMWGEWFSPPVAAFGRTLELRAMPFVYRTSLFIAVSDSTRRELQGLGVDEERIRLVHNATLVPETIPEVADPSARPVFVAVGRLVPHKRLHLLLEQWPRVRAATGGELVIVGEGPERERLEALLTPGARLAGRLSDDERDALVGSATVLLHPSHVEGWGLVIMEAAAQGTPSIGFDVPGVRDSIVHGSTGWICPDLDSFVERWIDTVLDPEAQLKAADAARDRAHRFGVDELVDGFEAVLVEAVERHRKPNASARMLEV